MQHFFHFTRKNAKINIIPINWLAKTSRLFPYTLACYIYRPGDTDKDSGLYIYFDYLLYNKKFKNVKLLSFRFLFLYLLIIL
jgi:hypothetical protein